MHLGAGPGVSLDGVFRQLGLEIGVLEADRRPGGIDVLDFRGNLAASQQDDGSDQRRPPFSSTRGRRDQSSSVSDRERRASRRQGLPAFDLDTSSPYRLR
jgi:hypothetical protein